jgi:hypothetical protein
MIAVMRFRPVTPELALVLESHGPVLSWTSFSDGGVLAFSVPVKPRDLRAIVAILDTSEQAWTSPDGLLEVRVATSGEVSLLFKKPGGDLVADVERELVLRGDEVQALRAAFASGSEEAGD